MTPAASVPVPGGRLDVGRQGSSVALRVLTHEGQGCTLLPTPEAAERLGLALVEQARRARAYRCTAPKLVAPEPPEAA